MTLPPLPPSPPDGPPRGTLGSRRNVALPAPPLPAWTSMVHSSMNCMRFASPATRARQRRSLGGGSGGFGRLDAHAPAHRAAALELGELDGAVDEREDGVVAPEADVEARVDH